MSYEVQKIYTPATPEEIIKYAKENKVGYHAAKTKINSTRYYEAKLALKEHITDQVEMIILDVEFNGDKNCAAHVKTLALLLSHLSRAV